MSLKPGAEQECGRRYAGVVVNVAVDRRRRVRVVRPGLVYAAQHERGAGPVERRVLRRCRSVDAEEMEDRPMDCMTSHKSRVWKQGADRS